MPLATALIPLNFHNNCILSLVAIVLHFKYRSSESSNKSFPKTKKKKWSKVAFV